MPIKMLTCVKYAHIFPPLAGADIGLLKGGGQWQRLSILGGPGHAPGNILVLGSLKWHFQHFESHL